MFNNVVSVLKACRNLAPPYLKQLFISSNTRATSRFITLPKPTIDICKTTLAFSGASLWECYSNSNKVLQFTQSFKIQLYKWFRNRIVKNNNCFLVCNMQIHARIASQCYYNLIYYQFLLCIMIIVSHGFPLSVHMQPTCLNVCNCF